MSWQPEVDEIEKRRGLARQQGGEKSVARHHKMGKLTLRERFDALLDEGSFQEQGRMAGTQIEQLTPELALRHRGDVERNDLRRSLQRSRLSDCVPGEVAPG